MGVWLVWFLCGVIPLECADHETELAMLSNYTGNTESRKESKHPLAVTPSSVRNGPLPQRKYVISVCVRVGGGSHSPPNSGVMLYDFPRPFPAPVTVYTCHGDKPSVSLYIYSQVW